MSDQNECARGHQITGAHDRLPSGVCRQCDRENVAKYNARRKVGMQLLKAFEARGIGIYDLPAPERLRTALTIVDAVDPVVLEHFARMDPDTVSRALRNLQALTAALSEDAAA
jgi:hypothetical protein